MGGAMPSASEDTGVWGSTTPVRFRVCAGSKAKCVGFSR